MTSEQPSVDSHSNRISVYVVVTGDNSDNEDQSISGYYQIDINKTLTDEQKSEIALDHFHANNAIAFLDDFTIDVFDESGNWLPHMEHYEPESLIRHGEYIGKIEDSKQIPTAIIAAANPDESLPDDIAP